MLYTASCPVCHCDAAWRQLPSITGDVGPYRYEITCRTCIRGPLPTTMPSPVGLPPVAPLILKGYIWARSVMGA